MTVVFLWYNLDGVSVPLKTEVVLVGNPDFDPDSEPDLFDEIEHMMAAVNFAVKVQALMSEGYTELWVRDPLTGRSKRIWIISLPN